MANITSKRTFNWGLACCFIGQVYGQHSKEHGHRQAGRMVLEQ